jgi:hypothetical protein
MIDSERKDPTMTLAGFEVDQTPYNMDGLLLHARDESETVEAFINRRVMDGWVPSEASAPSWGLCFLSVDKVVYRRSRAIGSR